MRSSIMLMNDQYITLDKMLRDEHLLDTIVLVIHGAWFIWCR